ncbi:MAG TPA: aminotransferase class I/II-fold pyridoxal phosphate-dependent enzyme [Bacteroidia bacterium]|jgi:O-succinylhomoserine sulfhydrylase|nr:aminotransferase class I/II-fold pyridoxal phosphate-dependent enzyme [Bacteroidia bacterium]HRG53561.1 aminotransferase class I/II-fold pyridoxal phosphate-dependent enzyme [Bacteroidia bacterium]
MKKFETNAIRTQAERSGNKEHSVPMYLTSSFMFDDAEEMRAMFADEKEGNIYSRFTNPNTSELVNKMCLLEGAEAGYATASGMAAVFASFMALLKTGDHILASSSIFGSTHTLFTKFLPKWGITHTYADVNKPEKWESLIQPNTKMIFVETPSNPGLDIIDLEWLGILAKKHNLILNVDNCFATPFIQRPIEYGAHLVTHSATKYIDGQGRVLGGLVVGQKELIKEIYAFCRSSGPSMSPFNAWTLSKSLETLSIRMERHSQSAHKLASLLENHPEIERVRYPFLTSHPMYDVARKQMSLGGGIVAFNIKGGLIRGRKFLDALELCSLTANLGDSRTIATHPASTTHAKLTEEERLSVGITPGLVRISVGLENIIDIVADIEQALEKTK